VPHRAGIHAVSELKGHTLMDAPGSDDIEAKSTERLIWRSRRAAYGFDFYGDNLCTSKRQIAAHSERTAVISRCKLKGVGLCARPQGRDR
jgi:hypothetical protein